MFQLSSQLITQYRVHLVTRGIKKEYIDDYQKWLRFFLDFSEKYCIAGEEKQKIRLFVNKLKEKKQSEDQRRSAYHAVFLYFEMLKQDVVPVKSNEVHPSPAVQGALPATPNVQQHPVRYVHKSYYSEAGYQEKSDSSEWDAVLEAMAAEIKVRHYSRKTLKTYANWSRQFQRYLKNKPPQELSTADVKDYLTHLAVKCKVASTTQNQAFNSLLFLYRHGLKREFGELRDVPRAKKSLYIPMVLSREEIDAILAQLSHPFSLVVKLLFGCGLRQFECLQLRVRDFNFDAGILTIHGKGKKDRAVPIPEATLPELRAQIKAVGELHDRDLAAGYTPFVTLLPPISYKPVTTSA